MLPRENLKFRSSKTAGNAPKSRILIILSLPVGMHLYSGIKKIVLHVVHAAKIGSACARSRRVLPYFADLSLACIYQAMQIQKKKVFYCFYKLTFPRKNTKLFVRAPIKREILTSCEVLYTMSCTRNQFCFSMKMLSKIRMFLA